MNKIHHERVRWACRRGMLELDLFLMPFFEHCYFTLKQCEQATFSSLLKASDPELFAWLMSHAVPKDKDVEKIVGKIRHYRLHGQAPCV